jgi:hypothetical protein
VRSISLKTILKITVLAVTVLLLTAGASFAQEHERERERGAPVSELPAKGVIVNDVSVDTASGFQTLTLHNEGREALKGIELTFSGPFSRSTTRPGTCETILARGPASTCTINIVFQPTTEGAASGSLTINASNGAVTGSPVGLTGNGILRGALSFALVTPAPTGVTLGSLTIPTQNVTAPTLQFGHQTSTVTAQVTLKNSGTAPLVFSNVSFANLDGKIFTQTNNCPVGGAGLAVNATCTLNVTLTPRANATDTHAAVYTFIDNGTGSPQLLDIKGH